MENPSLGAGSRKTNILRGDCLKRGAWTVCRFLRRLAQREVGGVFEGGGAGGGGGIVNTPMRMMAVLCVF